MSQTPADDRARRRAGLTLLGIIAAVAALIGALAAVVIAHYATGPASAPGTSRGTAPAPPTTSDEDPAAARDALASRPMLQLPPQAAQPQVMTTQIAGPAITLPQPTLTGGRWIPGGFPATAEGALAQLQALNETGMNGGDPQVYARAYRELSLPGAPDPGSTGLSSVLTSFRSHAGLPDTGTVPELGVIYQITHGLVKGSTDAGRYTVVCVLGQLSVDYQGRTISAGVGDCQAMRWTGTDWRISPGALAAPASSAWPGSADALKAGYRGLT
ncbi:MAG: hypothetical protein ACRDTH_02310 [Pseudonocardiaceae bacterium]